VADVRASPATLLRRPQLLEVTLVRCAAAAGLLLVWTTFLLARPMWSPLIDQTQLEAELVAPTTVALIAIAVGLAHGSFVSWWAAAGVLAASLLVALCPGHPWAPTAVAAVVLLIVLPAGYVRLRGAPGSWARGWIVAGLSAEATAAVLGISAHLRMLPVSFLAGGILAAAVPVHLLQRRRPLSFIGGIHAEQMRLSHGRSHVSCFSASGDKQVVMLPSGAMVGFRVAARVAVVAGDPLGRPDEIARAVEEFVALCGRQGWAPCFFQTTPAARDAYRRANLRVTTFGEEAVVDLEGFSLDGRRHANLRHEVTRARRAGLAATVLTWSEASETLRADLERVSDAWLSRHSHREMGFSVGRFGETIDGSALLTVVRAPSGEIEAFSTWLRLGEGGIGLDLIRRRPDASPGANDLCLAATLEAARQRGLRVASLGMVPFRDAGEHLACGGRIASRVRSVLFTRCIGGYRYRTLARFKDKFGPRWEPRDIAFPRGFAAPRVLVGLIAVHLRRSR
jgi:lysylphosphatidylglycerol synthetase-like protein (DUF2156 family)